MHRDDVSYEEKYVQAFPQIKRFSSHTLEDEKLKEDLKIAFPKLTVKYIINLG